jgi:hypothetical protein
LVILAMAGLQVDIESLDTFRHDINDPLVRATYPNLPEDCAKSRLRHLQLCDLRAFWEARAGGVDVPQPPHVIGAASL